MSCVLLYCSVVRCGLCQPHQSSIASVGYLLGNIREYAGWGIVNTGADVERIRLWSCL